MVRFWPPSELVTKHLFPKLKFPKFKIVCNALHNLLRVHENLGMYLLTLNILLSLPFILKK